MDDRLGSVKLVRGNENCASSVRRVDDEIVDYLATLLVEASMGFIEQPEFRSSRCRNGDRGATALACRKAANRHVVETAIDLHAISRRTLLCFLYPCSLRPKAEVLANSQIGIEHRLVPDVPNAMTHQASILRQVDSQDAGDSLRWSKQPGTQAQQRRLSRAVRAAEQN